MRRLLFIFLFACTLCCCIHAQNNPSEDPYKEDMFWLIDNIVGQYYYTYFTYPKDVDDLIEFTWNKIKNSCVFYIIDANKEDYPSRSSQYEDFTLSTKTLYERLSYLEFYKKDIRIRVEDGTFHLNNPIDGLFVDYTADVCYEIKDYLSKLFEKKRVFLFVETNKEMIFLDYSLLATQLRDAIKNKKHLQYALLKYEKLTNKLTPICPIENINNKSFLKIHSLLSEFARKQKDVFSIIVLTPIEIVP